MMQKQIAQTTEKQRNFKGIWKKIDAFLDKNYAIFFAPLVVVGLYLAALYAYGVFPFGEEYTAASYDLSAQICPFIEHLFDVLQGKSTLTYSYAIVGGADVTGTFLYFFLSPFSFLFLLFGDGRVAYASSIVMVCKLAAIAVAGAWFAKKNFQNIPDYICVAVGVIYTYCGYTFVSNTYINWMDFLIYMPFCAGAFMHFVKTGKFLPFSILVSCCIYTCFSIACFSLFTVFPALIFYGLICVKKEERNGFITYLVCSFLVAILLSLPVLMPALASFLNGARGGELFENLWFGFKIAENGSFSALEDSSSFFYLYADSLYKKWTYILSDSVFVGLTILWFCRNGVKKPFVKFMLLAGGMTLLPLIVDEAMNLLNMGSYMSYSLRFGFLNALYFLGGACLAIEGICFEKGRAYNGVPLFKDCAKSENGGGMVELNADLPSPKKEKASRYIPIIFYLLFVAVIAFITATVVINEGYKSFLSHFTKDGEALESLDSFASRFAHSLGGLEVIIILAIVVFLLLAVGVVLVWKKKLSPRLLSWFLLVVVGMQVVFYNNQLVVGNRSTQHTTVGHYQTLCEKLNESDMDYFRVKDYDSDTTACMPFSAGTNAFTVFSSMIDADNFPTYQLFGYLGNGKNSYKSAHNDKKYSKGEVFGDSFLGYKYFIVASSEKSEVEKLSYLKPVMIEGENGEKTQLQSGNFYVYENKFVFPLGYCVQSGEYRFVKENISNSTYRKENQLELYKFLRGADIGLSSITVDSIKKLSAHLWNRAADVEVSAGKITARVTAEQGECLFLNFVASKGYTVTVNGKRAELIENDLNFISVALEEGENEVVCAYTSPYPKFTFLGVAVALAGLFAVWFVLQKTLLLDKLSGVVAWAGVLVSTAVVAFFMLYPSCVFIIKCLISIL